jgi:hypothetical protein
VSKMRENRLRWFDHVMSWKKTNVVRVVKKINVKGKRGRERSQKRWLDTIENDMRAAVGVCVGVVENRDEWRFKTRVADPK